MPNINDINGVTVANLAKLDAVLKANISKVNGLTLSAAFTGLLDTYTGAAAAYSTRRLYSLYTGAALRVREDSGDTETDIGFDLNGDLDTAAIATHCGTANGYVVTWYGQESSGSTGSGNDATQSTASAQPQIYNGTSIISENGKPIIKRVSASSGLETSLTGNATAYIFTAAKVYSGDGHILISDLGQAEWLLASRAQTFPTDSGFSSITYYHNGSSTTYANQSAVYADAQNQSLFTIAANTSNIGVGYEFGNTSSSAGSAYSLYSMHEVIIYHSDQSSNRTGIESDINTYFSIY